MPNLSTVIQYICKEYPLHYELSDARVTKMIYLADWIFAVKKSKKFSGINWYYNHFGPYVSDIAKTANSDPALGMKHMLNAKGSDKWLIFLTDPEARISIDSESENLLDAVIDLCRRKTWNEFIDLVYSTFPIVTQQKYTQLDLINLADDFKRVSKNFSDPVIAQVRNL